MNTYDSPVAVLHESPPRFFRRLELRHVFLTLIGVGAVAIACIPTTIQQKQAAAAPIALHVTATEFKFQANTPNVAASQPVIITFENRGTIEHNLDLQATGTHLVAASGQTVSASVTFASSADLTYICTVPGHEQAGMASTLQVGERHAQVAADSSAPGAKPQSSHEAPLAPLPADTPRVPQGQIAPPVHRSDPALVKVNLAIQEVIGQLADSVGFRYWTFGGTVPGPMIRVRQGDTVELTLTNPPGTEMTHSINVHAAIGPGGGAVQIPPGEQNTFRFKADRPGVWVYHCMTPTVGNHVANGMFGMVVVEPPQGLPPVDREFYVMQSEAYLQGDPKAPGLHGFALDKLLREEPDYVVYNGSVGSLTDDRAMVASVGDRARFFFGVGGPNLDSAFHVVGLAWDQVHPEGAAETLTDVQTTLVPPGGATMTELTLSVPGLYMMEDHHITRLEKGAFAHLDVQGNDNPTEFEQNAHHDAGTPVPAAPASPFSITEEPTP
jgi:nitrite reductase (NO-forming)